MSDQINPYSSPQFEQAPGAFSPPPESTRGAAPYVSTAGLTSAVVVLLSLTALCHLVGIGSSLLQVELLQRGQTVGYSMEEANANDARQRAIALIQLALLVPTATVFCMWMYRSHKNLPALGAKRLQYSPGWAAGSWFIPILNLFRPYQIMQEIWGGSDPRWLNHAASAGSSMVGCWWALWIIGGFVSQFEV